MVLQIVDFCDFSDVDKIVRSSQGDGRCDVSGIGRSEVNSEGDGVIVADDGRKRKFKKPQNDNVIGILSNKKFAEQSKKKIMWAVNMYCDWRKERLSDVNVAFQIKKANLNCLSAFDQSHLCYSLARFIREVKKLDDSEYPPNTLKEIIIMIQMYLHENGVYWKLLDHPEFINLRNVVDNTMGERTAMGLGVKKSSDIITLEHESKLFECGEFGDFNPQQLLNTVVYMVGIHCALRGGVEHQRLRRPGFHSQIQFKTDDKGVERVVYYEDPLHKTAQGGIGCKSTRKVVNVYPSSNPTKCPVRIIKKYCNLLPTGRMCQKFFLRPRAKFTPKTWYCDQPYGNHKISATIKEMCSKAGLDGKFTNHSLRASSASRMYVNDIPEQVIKEITDHRSECVRMYKKTPEEMKKHASHTISGSNDCQLNKKQKTEVVVDGKGSNGLTSVMKERLDESLNACKMIKNVVKTRLEMRKKQGDKDKVCKRKVAQKLIKKGRKRVLNVESQKKLVIDVNLRLK